MGKLISLGTILGGLLLIFVVAPNLMRCSSTAGVAFCSDTLASYAAIGIGGVLLLAGAATLAIAMNRDFQQSLEEPSEHPLSQGRVDNK